MQSASVLPAREVSRYRIVSAVLMVLAVVPYAVLKVCWLTGHQVGVPAGSPAASTEFIAANVTTLALDLAALGLTWVLCFERGQLAPDALVLVPAWVGAGFLAPIVAALPFGFAWTLASEGRLVAMEDGLVADWAYTVVYTSFFAQGVLLALMLAGYVRRRWGSTLYLLTRPSKSTWFDQLTVTLAALLALGTGGTQWFQAYAAPAGWHNAEWTVQSRFVTWVMGTAALLAATALAALARPGLRAHRRPAAFVTALIGSAVMFSYGLLNTFSTLASAPLSELTPTPERLLHFAGLLAGGLGALAAGHLLSRTVDTRPN